MTEIFGSSIDHVILGAGGAGRTTAAISALSGHSALVFLDDREKGKLVNGFSVQGTIDERWKFKQAKHVIAFGTRFQRERVELFNRMIDEGFDFFNAIFPGNYVDETAVVGKGNVLAAGSKVLPNAFVGNNCFFCVTSSVDHDCRVEDGVYLAPGATLCGGVIVEEGAFIGANATVLPEIRIGRYAIVGAGAVVARDVPASSVVVGIPARQK